MDFNNSLAWTDKTKEEIIDDLEYASSLVLQAKDKKLNDTMLNNLGDGEINIIYKPIMTLYKKELIAEMVKNDEKIKKPYGLMIEGAYFYTYSVTSIEEMLPIIDANVRANQHVLDNCIYDDDDNSIIFFKENKKNLKKLKTSFIEILNLKNLKD